jgi:hypothetical protein
MPDTPKYLRHLKTTLLAHQKLATLSSKMPLPKGNMRSITFKGACGNGVRKGEKMTRMLATVVAPSLAKRVRLISQLILVITADKPLKSSQPNTFPKQVATDRWSIVKSHLLE